MRKHLRVLAAAALALSLAGVAAADDRVQAFIPFDFTVRGQTMTAGTYYVSRNYGNGLLKVDGLKQAVFILGYPVDAQNPKESQTRLIFHRYGDKYFLNEVWLDDGRGYQLPQSMQERETARSASAGSPTATVSIAMTR